MTDQHHEPELSGHEHQFKLNDKALRKYFDAAIKHLASDVLFKPNVQVRLRIRTKLMALETEILDDDQFENVIEEFITPDQLKTYHEHGSVDLAYDFDDDNRFRINVFRTRGHSAMACRRVSSEILSYDQLKLPPVLHKIAQTRQGMVLMCGITGCGKSTTIASMLEQINQERACHILTIEDPIEFLFKDHKAMINQREIGVDVPDFETGLKALVRENPDVVLIGEMRDKTTFQSALQAAETGHLVFGTVHASSATQVFGRIYNLFPPTERDLIRDMLSKNLVAVVYQKLIKSLLPDAPRVPAVEILLNNVVVAKYLVDQREIELDEVIKSYERDGMIDFSSSLVELVKKEYIHPKEALANAINADELNMRLKGMG